MIYYLKVKASTETFKKQSENLRKHVSKEKQILKVWVYTAKIGGSFSDVKITDS